MKKAALLTKKVDPHKITLLSYNKLQNIEIKLQNIEIKSRLCLFL